jgi:hypothetical protein
MNIRKIGTFMTLMAAAMLVACATPAPAPQPPPAAPAAEHAELFRAPFGYEHVVLSDGTERYCRNDLDTGTRVARTRVCLTQAQLEASQSNSQSFIDDVQRHGAAAIATGTPGVGGMMSPR